ncbi:MAG: S8 family serine peptidase [Microcoleaceae cyanobacterium]
MFESSLDATHPFNLNNSLFVEDYPLSAVDKIPALYSAETTAEVELNHLSTQPLSSIDDIVVAANLPFLTTDALTGVTIEPGNTLFTARDLGSLTGTQTQVEYVDFNDWYDYYRIHIDNPSNLNLALEGIGGDADLSLIQDINQNGFVEYNEIIDTSYSFTNSEQINITNISPGFYYVRVSQWSGATNYTLSLTANPSAPALPDFAGNNLPTARLIGGLETPQTFSDIVSNGDPIDFYRFDLAADSSLNLSLDQLTADADVAVIRDINGDGLYNYTEILQTSTNSGITPENLSANLIAGSYYVAVFQYEGDTPYNLTLSTTPTPPLPTSTNDPATEGMGFDVNLGYGLINASGAVAAAQGLPTGFVDVPDLTSGVGFNNTTSLNQIQVPEVWNQGITGEGVVVAVLDSGVDVNHPDLINNIWLNADEVPNNGIDDDLNGYVDDIQGYDFEDNDSDPSDIDSHGTHVAGIIAAARDGVDLTRTGGAYEVSGVAYDAEIMPVRVFSDVGSYKTPEQQDAAIASGIRYAVDNGASVINMSLGMPFWSSAWLDLPLTNAALTYAADNNVVAVIAAGNERDLGGTFPSEPALQATNGSAIAVGAVDSNGFFAEFSNPAGRFAGPYPYVVAPGVEILSTTPNDGYAGFSGTSMAAPHVTGVVALMQQANPNLTPAEIATLLALS